MCATRQAPAARIPVAARAPLCKHKKLNRRQGKGGDMTDEKMEALQAEFIETDEMADYLDFTEKVRDAVERGDSEVTVPTAFLARVIPSFQPLDFPHLREAYNALCDRHGLPEARQSGKGKG
jgi:hypothetical protein